MTESYDPHSEYRQCSRGGAVYLVVEGFLWLLSAPLGSFGQIPFAILVLMAGGMLIHPISLFVSRMAGLPTISKANHLPVLNTWLALMIPLGLPLVFMATAGGHTNLFFPAFSILIGVHWLPFAYVYAMRSFVVAAGVFVLTGVVFGFKLTGSFFACGFVVGAILLTFALSNFLVVRHELRMRT